MTYDEDIGGRKPYNPSKKDRNELKKLDDELFELHQQQEEARKRYQQAILSEPMEIGDELFVKDVIAHVRNFVPGDEAEVAKCRQKVGQITEFWDLTLEKLIEETNKDPETSKLRQTVIDKDWKMLPPELRNQQNNVSSELGSIYVEDNIFIPKSLREWILRVIHGDHESVLQMRL